MNERLFLDSQLPDELDRRVRSELRDNEQLLWVGQPRRRWFLREALPNMLIGIPVTAFAVFWISFVLWIVTHHQGQKGASLFFLVAFPLFGLPFLLIGVGLLSSPVWLRRKAQRTCYAVTDRRAIVLETGVASRRIVLRSYVPESLRKIERVEYSDGVGDLIFEEDRQVAYSGSGRRSVSFRPRGFMAIDNAREVETLIYKALLNQEDSSSKSGHSNEKQ